MSTCKLVIHLDCKRYQTHHIAFYWVGRPRGATASCAMELTATSPRHTSDMTTYHTPQIFAVQNHHSVLK